MTPSVVVASVLVPRLVHERLNGVVFGRVEDRPFAIQTDQGITLLFGP